MESKQSDSEDSPAKMSGAIQQLDVSQLQARVQDLTQAVSLRPPSPVRRGPGEDLVSSPSPDAVDGVLSRIREMERRQHFFEAILGGEGAIEEELQAIRNKRLQLEDKQISLELELKKLHQRLMIDPEIVPVHANKSNESCPRCESAQRITGPSEKLRSALSQKERELKILRNKLKEKETLIQAQKEQLSCQADQLSAAKTALEAENIQQPQGRHSRSSRQNGQDYNLAQRELTLLRKTHELETARSRQQAEQQALQAERSAVEQMRRELERERQDFERSAKTAHSAGREAQIRVQAMDLDVQRRRLNEERKELEAERRLVEAQRRELTEAYTALENPPTNTSNRSWWQTFSRCCTHLFD